MNFTEGIARIDYDISFHTIVVLDFILETFKQDIKWMSLIRNMSND